MSQTWIPRILNVCIVMSFLNPSVVFFVHKAQVCYERKQTFASRYLLIAVTITLITILVFVALGIYFVICYQSISGSKRTLNQSESVIGASTTLALTSVDFTANNSRIATAIIKQAEKVTDGDGSLLNTVVASEGTVQLLFRNSTLAIFNNTKTGKIDIIFNFFR